MPIQGGACIAPGTLTAAGAIRQGATAIIGRTEASQDVASGESD